MLTFGRKPSKKVGISNNKGMTGRANTHLEAYAVTKAENYATALGVDAPNFYFWHKEKGSIPCSCTATRFGPNRDVEIGGTPKESTTFIKKDGKPEFKVTQPEYGNTTLEDIFGNPIGNRRKSTLDEKLKTQVYDDPAMTYDGGVDDDILDIDSMSKDGTTDFEDPLNLFGDKVIYCPVCLGSGFIDAWNVHAGKRYVFDTSNAYNFDSQGINIDDTVNPTLMTTELAKAAVFWAIKLPLIWDKILRIEVFNGVNRIEPFNYTWLLKDSNNNVEQVTAKSLNALNDTADNIKLSIEFADKDITFTHAEIVFAFRDPYKAQIPEIQQGYEAEFLDWNVTLSVELPPDLQISEGDYLTESKYRKVWKVSTLTRKVTAGGTVFGLSADLRALHSFERNFIALSLFANEFQTYNLVK